jgi:hypothetical protein
MGVLPAMKTSEEIMEILAAYDLTGGYRWAAVLVGCDPHSISHGRSGHLVISGWRHNT